MKNEDVAQMREVMQELLGKKEDEGESKSRRHDKYYFNSYEDAHIHAEMIKVGERNMVFVLFYDFNVSSEKKNNESFVICEEVTGRI